jgi:uncharacterized membrane protein YccF (DUF307 family)
VAFLPRTDTFAGKYTIGNLLWIFFGGGLLLFLEYLLGGLLLCLTIVGIPFGLQCFKLTGVALLPFGKQLEDRASATGCLSLVMNIIWICFGGIWIALTHLVFAGLCALTIIRNSLRHSAPEIGFAEFYPVRKRS